MSPSDLVVFEYTDKYGCPFTVYSDGSFRASCSTKPPEFARFPSGPHLVELARLKMKYEPPEPKVVDEWTDGSLKFEVRADGSFITLGMYYGPEIAPALARRIAALKAASAD